MSRNSTKSHECENKDCKNISEKDKYGNYKRYCSSECKDNNAGVKLRETYKNKNMDEILEKRKATTLARYGVDNVSKTKAVKDKLRITTTETAGIRTQKTKATNLERYGVESTNSLSDVKEKKRNSFLQKYGVDHQLKIPEIAERVSKKNSANAIERLAVSSITKKEKYGDENYNNCDKYKETCLDKFGVENPSQNAEIHEKQFKVRNYTHIFESGRIDTVQGYEGLAIKELLKLFHEDDIILGKGQMPEIWYTDGTTKHRYFPDIYIPKENLLIEVKSEWTWDGKEGNLETNLLKKQGVIDSGYKYLLIMLLEW